MWNVEDLMIEADMRGDDGSYEAVVDTLAALGDDARKARKESERGDAVSSRAAPRVPAPAGTAAPVARSDAAALRQLRERIERTMAHAQDTQRWLSADYPPTEEAVWRLSDAQRHLLRARNAVWAAEEKMRS